MQLNYTISARDLAQANPSGSRQPSTSGRDSLPKDEARRQRPFGLATRARRVRLRRQQPKQSNATTRRLAIMNLAIRGIEADFGPEHADTFRRDLHPDLRADYVLANPPFNDSDTALRDSAFLKTGGKLQVMIERHDNRSKDDDVRRTRRTRCSSSTPPRKFKTGRAQNELLPEHVERVHNWVRDYTDVKDTARVVSLDAIAANDHNFDIPCYVEPKDEQEVSTVEEPVKRLRESAMVISLAYSMSNCILARQPKNRCSRLLKNTNLVVSKQNYTAA